MISDPVTNGREALDRWNSYPWYDAKTDGLRRVEVSDQTPWDPSFSHYDWVPSVPGSVLQWFAWIIIGLLVCGILYLLFRAYRQRMVQPAGKRRVMPTLTAAQIEALPVPLPKIPTDWLSETRRCYESGDYAQAIIYLFSYQLVRLDDHQLIRLGRGKTNRQYLRELGPKMALSNLLSQTMTTFEEVFFGHRPLGRNAFDRCWSRLDEFDNLVEGDAT